MKLARVISAVDSHTVGQPTRVITGGIPHLPGRTMAEKRDYFRARFDYLRTALMLEPRGHNNMYGAVLTAPTNDQAHAGVFFIDGESYQNMCGHGTIGVVTVMVETGMVAAMEPLTKVLLETPAGPMTAYAHVRDGVVEEVTLRMVPAFFYRADATVKVPDLGEVTCDISYGGNFFAILPASRVGLKVAPEYAPDLIRTGIAIKRAANEQLSIAHPLYPYMNRIEDTIFRGEPAHPSAQARNVATYSNWAADRSPCGTGTNATLAMLYARGELALGQEFVNESILGTLFKGRVLETTKVGDYPGVLAEVTGSAYITGLQQFVIDERDPLKYGFIMRG